jgi:hypothetical protein
MKIITLIICSIFICSNLFAKQAPEGYVHKKTEIHVPQETVNKFVSAILASDDLCTKIPVLKAAFRDCKEWEVGLQNLIKEEKWDLAQALFVEFYWLNVSKPNKQFLDSQMEKIRSNKDVCEFSGNIEKMVKNYPNKQVEPTPTTLVNSVNAKSGAAHP